MEETDTEQGHHEKGSALGRPSLMCRLTERFPEGTSAKTWKKDGAEVEEPKTFVLLKSPRWE